MISSSVIAATTSCGILATVILAMFTARARLKGTTLVGPWAWMQIALLALLVTQLATAGRWLSTPAIRAAVEFLAAAATICPLVSVLGAKRPQHRAWHFVVLSLWIVLVLPAAEVLLIRTGAELKMHAIRSAFLLALLLLGIANYALTRFSANACGYALGQWLLLGPTITHRAWSFPGAFAWGSALLGLAALSVCLNLPPRPAPRQGWNRAWLDFRDAFGSLWGLRVMERLNVTARRLGWKTELGWHGFPTPGDPQEVLAGAREPVLEAAVERSFRMLLRRFVADDWYPSAPPNPGGNQAVSAHRVKSLSAFD
jgi:hypothetical protein